MDDTLLAGLLERFAAADACWFSSTRPDGRAHLAPIWHVWLDGRAYMVTQKSAVRYKNIAHHPEVSLSLPDTSNVFILEGHAAVAPERQAALGPLFKAKYDWDFADDNPYNVIIEVTPRKVIAWGNEGKWQKRWRFDAEGNVTEEEQA